MALFQIAEPGESAAPHEHKRAIGIDLGTTNSVVSVLEGGEPTVIANADGVRELAGILTGREGTTVTLDTDNGPVAFEVNAASSVQLCDDEDLFD